MEMDCVIPETQFGFRKGRSCEDCLAILNLEIYNSFMKGECVRVMFLDIKSAYDNVYPSILFNKLNKLKIPWEYKWFSKNLLSLRSIEIYESGKYQGTRTLFKGLPLGSVLNPLLFNFYVKDIFFNIPYNCKLVQLAVT